MAERVFKGYVLTYKDTFEAASFNKDKETLYFVRTSGTITGGTDGYLYFNGKKYGTAKDLETALINDESEYTNFKAVGDALRAIKADIGDMNYNATSSDTKNIVSVGLVQESGHVKSHTVTVATSTIGGSGDDNFIAFDPDTTKWSVGAGVTGTGITQANDLSARLVADEKVIASGLNRVYSGVTAETAARIAAIEALDANVSSITGDKYITVQIGEVDGKLTGVTLTDVTASMLNDDNHKFREVSGAWSGRATSVVTGLATIEGVEATLINDEAVIAAALNQLSGQIKTNEVKIFKESTAQSGMAATYYLAKVGATSAAERLGEYINIPLDQVLENAVLQSGAYIKSHSTEFPYAPTGLVDNHMYLVLKFQNVAKEVYLDVHDLVDEIQAVSSSTTIKMTLVDPGAQSGVSGTTIVSEIQLTSITDDHIATNAAISRTKLDSPTQNSLHSADTAVQVINDVLTGTSVTINSNHIKLGTEVTGLTTIPVTSSITEALQELSTQIHDISGISITTVTSTGGTIDVTASTNKVNIDVNLEPHSTATTEAGHITIVRETGSTDTGALYGVMYFSGDDVDTTA